VVALVADVDADVVEHRGIFQPLALTIGEAVNGPRLVEELACEARDLICVLGPEVAALRELVHAPAPDVWVAVGLRDLLPVPRDVIEHEPLAEREVAQGDLVGVEPAHHRVEEHGPGDGEVRPPRLEPGHPQALLEVELDELAPDAPQLFVRHAPVAKRGILLAPFLGRGNRAEA
jgi:hypothetical protein